MEIARMTPQQREEFLDALWDFHASRLESEFHEHVMEFKLDGSLYEFRPWENKNLKPNWGYEKRNPKIRLTFIKNL